MARPVSINDTVTLYPSGYDSSNSSIGGTNTNYPISTAYNKPATNTTYARITCNTGSNATTYISYTFDCSLIPQGVNIDSVSCTVGCYISSTSYLSSAYVRLYSGSTAKGNQTSCRSTSTSTTYTPSAGSWTRAELDNIQIRMTATRGTSNTSRSAYLYFRGATLNITYSLNGTMYTVAVSSTVTGVTGSPASLEGLGGTDATVTIEAASIDDIVVTDNGDDVTGDLIRHNSPSGSYTDTFIPSSFDSTNSRYDTTGGDNDNGIYSTNIIANGLTDHNSNTRCALYSVQGSGLQSYMYYNFDVSSIPANATITSVSCLFKGGTQGTSYYSSYTALLTSGTTAKGTALSVTGSNGSPSTVTINGGSSWTRAELENIKIKFSVTRGSSNTTTESTWSFFGATLTVEYTVTPTNPYYWTYELTDLDEDHAIVIEEAGVFIPPEEDPTYEYESITISSINATTTPNNGTTRVIKGSNQTITISPTDPLLTLALDNGVDITSLLVGGTPTNTYTVTTLASGASYGFNLNNSTGYYVSQNTGIASSAAVCRVNFTCESDCLVTILYINYAEATYDYGIFGLIDTALGTTYTADSNTYLSCRASSQNTSSPQTITYNLTAGSHFIDIKYRKDSYTDSNNDNLQWKITSIQATGVGGDYTYTLSNIQTRHSLIFVFGDVDYYFITSSGNDCRLFPDGQLVKLAGDSYTIKIVPNNLSDTVSLADNNITLTLTREDGYDKNGNPAVSYEYSLSNILADHTLIITCLGNASNITLYVKENGAWKVVNNVYSKSGDTWMIRSNSTWETFFSTSGKYVKG